MKVTESIIFYIRESATISRILTGIVLFFFSSMQFMQPALAAPNIPSRENDQALKLMALKASAQATNARSPGVEVAVPAKHVSTLGETLGKTRTTVNVLHQQLSAGAELGDASVVAKRKMVHELLAQLADLTSKDEESFKADRAHIEASHLAPAIKSRYSRAVATYQNRWRAVHQALAAADNSADKAALVADLGAAQLAMSKVVAPSRHKPLDQKNMPFGLAKYTHRTPRTLGRDFAASRSAAPLMIASIGSLSELLGVEALPPSAGDLAPTEDVQLTQQIQNLAAQLGHDPVRIYAWVHDNIRFVPTYGSIQGSDQTLTSRQGNSFDTASLLIALYRASGIPAHYVTGTIQVPVAQVMNWVGGIDSAEGALQVLGQGGIPSQGLAQGGNVKFILLEQAWVEAYIGIYPGRGATAGSLQAWVPLDPSFKQYEQGTGIQPVSNPPFTSLASLSTALQNSQYDPSTGALTNLNVQQMGQVATDAQSTLNNYFTQYETAGQYILNPFNVQPASFSVLPSGLPYKVVAAGGALQALPASSRQSFQIGYFSPDQDPTADSPVFSYSASLPALAGHNLSLRFVPSTPADMQTIQSYLPTPQNGQQITSQQLPDSLPGYLINVTPQLTLDGQVVAAGPSTQLGQSFSMSLGLTNAFGQSSSTVSNGTAGEFYAISLNGGGMGANPLPTPSPTSTENILQGEGQAYWANLDAQLALLSQASYGVLYRQPSYGLFSTRLTTTYSYGIPHSVAINGVGVDVGAAKVSAAMMSGASQLGTELIFDVGLLGSALENEVPEEYALPPGDNTPGVSAARVLTTAVTNGQPLYFISSSNYSSVAPLLAQSPEVMSDIQNSIDAGQQVIISPSPVTIGSWQGAGYIITDPATGSGAYRLNGGEDGGAAYSNTVKALAVVGLGVLAGGIMLLAPKADAGGCGSEKQRQIDWQTILAIAIILLLIAAFLASTGGVGAVAGATAFGRALAVLLVTLLLPALDAQAATGTTCPVYYLGTTVAGNPTDQVQAHWSAAQGGGSPSNLHWNPVPGADRQWYDGMPECLNRTAAQAANNGNPVDCDEYPPFVVDEGGPLNYGPPNNFVSLKLLDSSQNRRVGPSTYAFARRCGVFTNRKFKVAMTAGATYGTDQNGEICYGGVP